MAAVTASPHVLGVLLAERGSIDALIEVVEEPRVRIPGEERIAENWYTGGRATILLDLVTGTRNPTVTSEDNYAVWELAEMVRRSPELD